MFPPNNFCPLSSSFMAKQQQGQQQEHRRIYIDTIRKKAVFLPPLARPSIQLHQLSPPAAAGGCGGDESSPVLQQQQQEQCRAWPLLANEPYIVPSFLVGRLGGRGKGGGGGPSTAKKVVPIITATATAGIEGDDGQIEGGEGGGATKVQQQVRD